MFKYQSIFFPELAVHVRFKIMDGEELELFLSDNENTGPIEYAANVLKTCVFNLGTDVLMSIIMMSKEQGNNCLKALYNGCLMLNPALSGTSWVNIAYSAVPDYEMRTRSLSDKDIDDIFFKEDESETSVKHPSKKVKPRAFKIPSAKFQNIETFLSSRVIGQSEAVKEIVRALRLHQAGLSDKKRPLGVFLFAGPSGVGKTLLAQELHTYLFGTEYQMLRIDCGEFQHKHENQKLLGSPPGYVAHDEGGMLSRLEDKPNTVVLLDEVEKAHPDVLNTFLRVFDEGVLTDGKNNEISFRNAIIIMTSNLGNDQVSELIQGKGAGFNASINVDFKSRNVPSREAVERATKEAMRKFFKPEFINRIDSTVIFNFLTEDHCRTIAELQLHDSEDKLSKLGFKLDWDADVIEHMVELGFTSVSNARGMRSVRSKYIDILIAELILDTDVKRGATITINVDKEKNQFYVE
jgi:ATP-dependent Clp protease ATP-binding subunit ClpA